jgi:hypothetical protein
VTEETDGVHNDGVESGWDESETTRGEVLFICLKISAAVLN